MVVSCVMIVYALSPSRGMKWAVPAKLLKSLLYYGALNMKYLSPLLDLKVNKPLGPSGMVMVRFGSFLSRLV